MTQSRYAPLWVWFIPVALGTILLLGVVFFAMRDARNQGRCEARGLIPVEVHGRHGTWCATEVVRP